MYYVVWYSDDWYEAAFETLKEASRFTYKLDQLGSFKWQLGEKPHLVYSV